MLPARLGVQDAGLDLGLGCCFHKGGWVRVSRMQSFPRMRLDSRSSEAKRSEAKLALSNFISSVWSCLQIVSFRAVGGGLSRERIDICVGNNYQLH